MPNMLLTPSVIAKESILLSINKGLPPGQYRAWMAFEWLALPLDDASELLWPRIKRSEQIINEDAPAFCAEFQNVSAKAWPVWDNKPGVHVLLTVA